MTEQPDLWSTHVYSGKTDTSKAAAASLGRVGSKRYSVALQLSARPMSDSQLQEHLGMSGNTQRARRVELRDMGFVEDSGRRVINGYGNPEVVWCLTEAGRRALEQVAA